MCVALFKAWCRQLRMKFVGDDVVGMTELLLLGRLSVPFLEGCSRPIQRKGNPSLKQYTKPTTDPRISVGRCLIFCIVLVTTSKQQPP